MSERVASVGIVAASGLLVNVDAADDAVVVQLARRGSYESERLRLTRHEAEVLARALTEAVELAALLDRTEGERG